MGRREWWRFSAREGRLFEDHGGRSQSGTCSKSQKRMRPTCDFPVAVTPSVSMQMHHGMA